MRDGDEPIVGAGEGHVLRRSGLGRPFRPSRSSLDLSGRVAGPALSCQAETVPSGWSIRRAGQSDQMNSPYYSLRCRSITTHAPEINNLAFCGGSLVITLDETPPQNGKGNGMVRHGKRCFRDEVRYQKLHRIASHGSGWVGRESPIDRTRPVW